jgi:hypothetical protein
MVSGTHRTSGADHIVKVVRRIVNGKTAWPGCDHSPGACCLEHTRALCGVVTAAAVPPSLGIFK